MSRISAAQIKSPLGGTASVVRSSMTLLMMRGDDELQQIHNDQTDDTCGDDQTIFFEIRQKELERFHDRATITQMCLKSIRIHLHLKPESFLQILQENRLKFWIF